MEFINEIFTVFMQFLFNAVGVAILLGISVAVAKVAFGIIWEILSYVWRTIHKPSHDKFSKKIIAKVKK